MTTMNTTHVIPMRRPNLLRARTTTLLMYQDNTRTALFLVIRPLQYARLACTYPARVGTYNSNKHDTFPARSAKCTRYTIITRLHVRIKQLAVYRSTAHIPISLQNLSASSTYQRGLGDRGSTNSVDNSQRTEDDDDEIACYVC